METETGCSVGIILLKAVSAKPLMGMTQEIIKERKSYEKDEKDFGFGACHGNGAKLDDKYGGICR